MTHSKIRIFALILIIFTLVLLQSCSTFKQRTYDEEANKDIDDPQPVYDITLDRNYQDFTTYMFIGNRIENFSTYFNTYFNATENFADAYDDYATRVLSVYSDRLDSIFIKPPLSQQSTDQFNAAIQKASKIIQKHKSSQFMDKSVLLVGKSYYYLGDYLKAERKFSEFLSKLPSSSLYEEAILFLAKTQMRLDNIKSSLETLDQLIAKSKNKDILSGAYQSKAEYYIYIKDYENGIKNFKQAIKYSTDDEFKAQMQFIVATVTERIDMKKSVNEYKKVTDYGVSFELEYLANFNHAKMLIANNRFGEAFELLDDIEVKYKDIPELLGEINYLKGTYYEQKKDMKRALEQYYFVIQNYPSTKPSSDASFRIAEYQEKDRRDFLDAYMYYRFSTEQNTAGTYYTTAQAKSKIFRHYFELRSIILGSVINTDYDSVFQKKVYIVPVNKDNEEFQMPGKETGKPGGTPVDSVEESYTADSLIILRQKVAQAKYELAELFMYDLNMPDSGEYYLKDAFESSDEYDFRAKVLFALANLYINIKDVTASEKILHQILQEFPSSDVAASSRRLLNLPAEETAFSDEADSLYLDTENKFLNRDYTGAMDGFKDIILNHPSSRYIDKCLYGSGWIYENILFKPDSAYYYYSSLVKASPDSKLVSVVSPKLSEYDYILNGSIDTSGVNKNDSLKQIENNNKEEQPENNIEGKDGEGSEGDQPPMKKDETEGENNKQ